MDHIKGSQNQIDWKHFLKSGDRIFIGSNAAVPNALMDQLIDEQASALNDIEVVHILTLGENRWAQKQYQDTFTLNALFLGQGTREAVHEGYADYTPCFLSEIPSLFHDKTLPIDVALISVSPPDPHGYCSLGVSVDVVHAAARSARYVIAQINEQMPFTMGDSFIHLNEIDAAYVASQPLPELQPAKMDPVTQKIGEYVALLIEDGATLQMGIGKIPDAVLNSLHHHRDLGIHTEMFSDGVIELMQKGIINNSRKSIHRHKTVTSFCIGTKTLYDFVHKHPHVDFHPSEYVNNPSIIAQNDKMVSINSAIEVDLTGQVVADSVGYRFFSGIGGQVDFIRGASMSRDGCPIIALPSTAKKGRVSRIVPFITEGSGVVTSRGDVHYVVTEYGIATLRGQSIRERALELIQVAHPDFREQLLSRVREQYWVPQYTKQEPTRVPELGSVEIKKIRLSDGQTYFMRPLHSSDERRLQEFFYSHNAETLMLRYRHQPKQMSREKAHSLVNVDQRRDLALCLTERQGPKQEIHAVGRYFYLDKENLAEVAFVVSETKRGSGMATVLLCQMMKIAQKRGVAKMLAYVRRDNQAMLHIFENYDFVRQPSDSLEEVVLCRTLESADQNSELICEEE